MIRSFFNKTLVLSPKFVYNKERGEYASEVRLL